MTWIELHAGVFFDKKILAAAASLTRGDTEKIVGHLARLWSWAIDHAEDGDLSHLSPAVIATAAGWRGRRPELFLEALKAAGLLDEGPRIHNWDRYSGKLVDRRKVDRARKEADRLAAKQAASADSSAGQSTGRRAEIQVVPDQTRPDQTEQLSSTSEDADARTTSVADDSRPRAALRRVRWYTWSDALDVPLLRRWALLRPEVDLAAEITRWGERYADDPPRRPRKALEGWLKLAEPADVVSERLPSVDEQLAEKQWQRLKKDDHHREAAWRILQDVRQGGPFRPLEEQSPTFGGAA